MVRAQARAADKDKFLHSMVDRRAPGVNDYIRTVNPGMLEREVSEVHSGFDYAIKNMLIDMYGIQSPEAFEFKYAVDQGEISGPQLANILPANSNYSAGYFAPASWKTPVRSAENTMKMPFSSAKIGNRPNPGTEWKLKKPGPFGQQNDLTNIVKNLYALDVGNAGAGPTAGIHRGSDWAGTSQYGYSNMPGRSNNAPALI